MNQQWECPYCKRIATITDVNTSNLIHTFNNNNKDGQLHLNSKVIVCPNEECREYSIMLELFKISATKPIILNKWMIKPNSNFINFPDYIPTAIKNDYEEASLIKSLSPKASATLARRCLQGMIRDFWNIKKDRLKDEIDGIKDKIDISVWEAIDGVRKIGNIGAHMEKDINLIVDVDPKEAELLLQLIEMLVKDWYIERHNKNERTKRIIELAKTKSQERKGK